jgi:hypothetical protein
MFGTDGSLTVLMNGAPINPYAITPSAASNEVSHIYLIRNH